jgi:hypothetical protein
MRIVTLATTAAVSMLLVASSVCGAQRWQCGDGLSVPLEGSRADREAACRELRERRDNPPDAAISQEQADRLRQRIHEIEKKYDVDVKVEKLDEK